MCVCVCVHDALPASTLTPPAGAVAFLNGVSAAAAPSLGCPDRDRDTQSQRSLCSRFLSFSRQGKQQTCVDRNTRHIHPWSDVVGGRGSVRMGVHWRTEDGGGEGEESVDGVRWE